MVLVRRSQFRLTKIEHRLDILDGLLIAYLNLDEVIRIVRYEEEPKAKLIERFELTEVQADAILNLRLKSLSRLEEIEIRPSTTELSKERRGIKSLLKSDDQQWERIADEVKATREAYSKKTALGAPPHPPSPTRPTIEADLEQAMIEKEPITVILSDKGWIRAIKGHMDDPSELEFKQGDGSSAPVKAADHRQAAAARLQRQGVHAARRQAPRRPRPRRARAPDGRPRGEPRLRRDLRARARAQAAGRRHVRLWLHRARGRGGRHDAARASRC